MLILHVILENIQISEFNKSHTLKYDQDWTLNYTFIGRSSICKKYKQTALYFTIKWQKYTIICLEGKGEHYHLLLNKKRNTKLS